MYASASPFASAMRRQPGALYHSVGVETGVVSANAHRLVAMLFDGLLGAIAQAQGAMARGDILGKGQAIGRAARIVEEGLKAGLNLSEGGRLAADLQDLYAYMTLRLTQANLHNDTERLEEVKRLVQPLRDAWESIGPQVNQKTDA